MVRRVGKVSRWVVMICIVVFLIIAGGGIKAHALSMESTSSFEVYPVGYEDSIIYDTVKAGDLREYSFKVTNTSTHTKKFVLYVADVLSAEQGGWTYAHYWIEPSIVGSWFIDNMYSKTFEPSESGVFTFRLKVPSDLKDGQYVGAVVLGEYTEPDSSQSEGVALTAGVHNLKPIQLVLEKNKAKAEVSYYVGEAVYKLESNGESSVILPHHNNGTILVKPKTVYELTDMQNNVLASGEVQFDSIYTSTTAEFKVQTKKILPVGDYIMSYRSEYGGITLEDVKTITVTKELTDNAGFLDSITNMSQGTPITDKPKDEIFFYALLSILLLLLLLVIYFYLQKSKLKKELKEVKRKQMKARALQGNPSSVSLDEYEDTFEEVEKQNKLRGEDNE